MYFWLYRIARKSLNLFCNSLRRHSRCSDFRVLRYLIAVPSDCQMWTSPIRGANPVDQAWICGSNGVFSVLRLRSAGVEIAEITPESGWTPSSQPFLGVNFFWSFSKPLVWRAFQHRKFLFWKWNRKARIKLGCGLIFGIVRGARFNLFPNHDEFRAQDSYFLLGLHVATAQFSFSWSNTSGNSAADRWGDQFRLCSPNTTALRIGIDFISESARCFIFEYLNLLWSLRVYWKILQGRAKPVFWWISINRINSTLSLTSGYRDSPAWRVCRHQLDRQICHCWLSTLPQVLFIRLNRQRSGLLQPISFDWVE